jgi:molecular chaperone IbpA
MTIYDDVFGKSFPFAIGFDRTLQLLERANHSPTNTNYPPYNIVKHDAENFSIELALAGFDKKDITISKEKNVLLIEGKQEEDELFEYVHKGLASRSFKVIHTCRRYSRSRCRYEEWYFEYIFGKDCSRRR